MPNIMTFNATIKDIVCELEKLNKAEQESILGYLRAMRVQKLPKRNFTVIAKPLSMSAIDAIKHKTRKSAGAAI